MGRATLPVAALFVVRAVPARDVGRRVGVHVDHPSRFRELRRVAGELARFCADWSRGGLQCPDNRKDDQGHVERSRTRVDILALGVDDLGDGPYTIVASAVATNSWTSATLTAAKNYWFEVTAAVGSNWTSAKSSATGESTINSVSPFCLQP